MAKSKKAPPEQAPVDKPAKLHLYVDLESRHVGISEMASGDVGHTWVALEWKDPNAVPEDIEAGHKGRLAQGGKYADSMGFWPDLEGVHNNGEGTGYKKNPFKSYVQGHLRNPDEAHQGQEKASQTYEITAGEAKSVLEYAEAHKAAQYSVYFYNCSTFAQKAVQAAGQSAPGMSKGGICLPDAVYDGIAKNDKKGEGETMVKGEDFVNQGWVGLLGEAVQMPPSIAYWADKPKIFMVMGFEPGSPAEGVLKVGDIITEFGGFVPSSNATFRRGSFGKINQTVAGEVLERDDLIAVMKGTKDFEADVLPNLTAVDIPVGAPPKKGKKAKSPSGKRTKREGGKGKSSKAA